MGDILHFNLTFNNGKGKTACISMQEMLFFTEPNLTKKIRMSSLIVSRLIRMRSIFGIYLFIKGAILYIFLKQLFTTRDYLRLWTELLGFKPKRLVFELGTITFRFNQIDKYTLWYGITQLDQIFIKNQYCLKTNIVSGKTLIDVGANMGFFSSFAALMGAKKVYAFEPVKETFEMLKMTIKDNQLEKRVRLINKALGKKNGKASIGHSGRCDIGASIVIDKGFSKTQPVDIITLDSFLGKNTPVDFIKIDAEGSESDILLGSKKIIRKYKPVLSFSAYHKPEDKLELPEIVNSIRKDYSCRLNNYAEADFYCQ